MTPVKYLGMCIGALLAAALCWAVAAAAQQEPEDKKPETEKPFRIDGNAEKGRVIYQQLCVTCHGEHGDGQGPAGRQLSVTLPDFADAEYMLARDDKDLFTTVKEGGAAVGKSGIMHSWKSNLNDQQIHDVLAYVRTFARPMAMTASSHESPAYD